jgi:hypothetical protein
VETLMRIIKPFCYTGRQHMMEEFQYE